MPIRNEPSRTGRIRKGSHGGWLRGAWILTVAPSVACPWCHGRHLLEVARCVRKSLARDPLEYLKKGDVLPSACFIPVSLIDSFTQRQVHTRILVTTTDWLIPLVSFVRALNLTRVQCRWLPRILHPIIKCEVMKWCSTYEECFQSHTIERDRTCCSSFWALLPFGP